MAELKRFIDLNTLSSGSGKRESFCLRIVPRPLAIIWKSNGCGAVGGGQLAVKWAIVNGQLAIVHRHLMLTSASSPGMAGTDMRVVPSTGGLSLVVGPIFTFQVPSCIGHFLGHSKYTGPFAISMGLVPVVHDKPASPLTDNFGNHVRNSPSSPLRSRLAAPRMVIVCLLSCVLLSVKATESKIISMETPDHTGMAFRTLLAYGMAYCPLHGLKVDCRCQ